MNRQDERSISFEQRSLHLAFLLITFITSLEMTRARFLAHTQSRLSTTWHSVEKQKIGHGQPRNGNNNKYITVCACVRVCDCLLSAHYKCIRC